MIQIKKNAGDGYLYLLAGEAAYRVEVTDLVERIYDRQENIDEEVDAEIISLNEFGGIL